MTIRGHLAPTRPPELPFKSELCPDHHLCLLETYCGPFDLKYKTIATTFICWNEHAAPSSPAS